MAPVFRPAYCNDFDNFALLVELHKKVISTSWEAEFLCEVNAFDFVLQSSSDHPIVKTLSVDVGCNPFLDPQLGFNGGSFSLDSQEIHAEAYVLNDAGFDLQTDADSLSTSTEVSGAISTDYAEMGIDPTSIFEDFIPRYDTSGGFFVNDSVYYESVTKTINRLVNNAKKEEGFAYSSIVHSNFENVNPLVRLEFLSPEHQVSLKYKNSIRTFAERDLIFEDRTLPMEICKKIVMARRDFFFARNGSTRGDLFLLNELQNRSLKTTFCRTPHFDLTQNLRCSDNDCMTTGPCLIKYGVIDLHNFSR